MVTKTSIIEFRDKSAIRPLPKIPGELLDAWRKLVKSNLEQDGWTNFSRLEAIYAFLDRYNAFVASFAVCQKGCNHCCRIAVSVTRLEAEYITWKEGPKLDQGKSITTRHNHEPCPFLSTGGDCSIYANRPFNCQTFHTLDDPKYCANGIEEHQTYGSAGKGYGVSVYIAIALWLKSVHESRDRPIEPSRDIRDWFPL